MAALLRQLWFENGAPAELQADTKMVLLMKEDYLGSLTSTWKVYKGLICNWFRLQLVSFAFGVETHGIVLWLHFF